MPLTRSAELSERGASCLESGWLPRCEIQNKEGQKVLFSHLCYPHELLYTMKTREGCCSSEKALSLSLSLSRSHTSTHYMVHWDDIHKNTHSCTHMRSLTSVTLQDCKWASLTRRWVYTPKKFTCTDTHKHAHTHTHIKESKENKDITVFFQNQCSGGGGKPAMALQGLE